MQNPLGKSSPYSDVFDPSVLFPIARSQARSQSGIREPLPFVGLDRWTCYELSWLNGDGLPQVAIATIEYPASTQFLVESKSLKLFLGSMNFTRYESIGDVVTAVKQGLCPLLGSDQVNVSVSEPEWWGSCKIVAPPGESVDREAVPADDPGRLRRGEGVVEEVLHSNLLRSLCPVTSQPDWGTVVISYRGNVLDRGSLVGYLRAHRSHQGFHEECCELIFADLMAALAPTSLWVGCFYTRRGGLDINPERWLPGTERPLLAGRFARQ